ncbi:MAG: hypothetical protein EHM37_23175, partial [Deltaproteobacteria bacterium]
MGRIPALDFAGANCFQEPNGILIEMASGEECINQNVRVEDQLDGPLSTAGIAALQSFEEHLVIVSDADAGPDACQGSKNSVQLLLEAARLCRRLD